MGGLGLGSHPPKETLLGNRYSPSGRGLEGHASRCFCACAACRPWRCFFATTLEPLSLSSRPGSKHAGRALGESSTFKRRPGMGRAKWYLGE